MSAVAKWLVGGVATTTKTNGGATRKTKGCAGGIDDFEVALDAYVPVGVDSDFG